MMVTSYKCRSSLLWNHSVARMESRVVDTQHVGGSPGRDPIPGDDGPGYSGSLGALVDVHICGCGSPCCESCSSSFAYKRAREFEDDCARMGVTRLATVCVTRAPDRFPNPHHVVDERVAPKIMREVWRVLGPKYRGQWGERPVYWSFREVHDGKRGGSADSLARGADHLHIYFPAPSKSGWIHPVKLKAIRECGQSLAGRTTWGWKRSGVSAVDVSSASPYAAKALAYATKGQPASDEMLDRVRIDMCSRSRAVSEGDPVNVRRREQVAEFNARKRAAVLAYKSTRRTFGPKSLATIDAKLTARMYYVSPRSRGPMRTHRERLARCGDGVTVMVGSQFVGTVDVPSARLGQVVSQALIADGLVHPNLYRPGGLRFGAGRKWVVPAAVLGEALDVLRLDHPERFGQFMPRVDAPSLKASGRSALLDSCGPGGGLSYCRPCEPAAVGVGVSGSDLVACSGSSVTVVGGTAPGSRVTGGGYRVAPWSMRLSDAISDGFPGACRASSLAGRSARVFSAGGPAVSNGPVGPAGLPAAKRPSILVKRCCSVLHGKDSRFWP